MNKEIYDKVTLGSIRLNELIEELKECQTEKEEILKWIDELEQDNKLEEYQYEIREKMNSNLKKFERVVKDIEDLKKKIKED